MPVLSFLEGEGRDAAASIGEILALDEKISVSTRRSLTWGMPHGQGLDDAPLKVTKFIPHDSWLQFGNLNNAAGPSSTANRQSGNSQSPDMLQTWRNRRE
jgi:hypothetical protein